ncbi:MAG: CSLREA domain-containing protein [Myxococcales bacterium]|nr:CSLREA domain-containing protein [Myxococcales bacterium]
MRFRARAHIPLVHRFLPLLIVAWCLPRGVAAQTTFTVTTTGDLDDGACDVVHCSLREAITAANVAVGGGLIAFQIAGTGPQTVQPLSALPPLEDDVTIDATTQPGFAGAPVIELDGSLAGNAHGFDIVGSNNLVRGFVINRFAWTGIQINTDCNDNVIEGNYIGTDRSGTAAQGNGVGVGIGDGSNNTVGGTTPGSGNLLSGNNEGVTIVGVTATGNVVIGNFIGTDVTGTAAIPNGVGVLLLAPNNRVGDLSPEARNVISGNQFNGIDLGPPNATGNTIVGNYLGVDAAGTAALGNDIGVFVNDVADNTIGGASAGARNIISGNREGVTLWDDGATGTLVQGNYIGTNAAGDAAVPNEMGVPVYSPENTIGGTEAGAGNLISGNQANGVNFYGEYATGNVLQGNLIGTDATGTTALGNGENGVFIGNAATDNRIGGTESGAGNVLSGNTFGILVGDLSISRTKIQGNLIGTNASGDQAIPNSQTGILLWGTDTVIGGIETGARNIISANGFAGIDLGPGSIGTVIEGNYIGTNAAGTAAMGNDLGIFVNFSPDNVIGGAEPGAGNVISGNVSLNVNINGIDASGNTFQGNYLGTDATGTVALENGRAMLIADAPDNTIGGTQSGARNVISGNLPGISIEGPTATGNVIQGNYIGVDVTGSAPLGNRGATIRFTTGASNNTVGGTEAGAGNIIANSSWVGIGLFPDAGTGNRILGNAIYDNGALGIELNRDGVTLNDEGDVDTGPNNLQNFPTLVTAAASESGAVIKAELRSVPSSSFLVDFFSDLTCDEEGHGEGRTPLGSMTVSTDDSGVGTAIAAFPNIAGNIVTATATDADGNTSEFSQCLGLATLSVSPTPSTQTVTQGQSASYAIGVSAEGGSFDETVSLSCSGAPSEATCFFDQDQIALVDGQASATMTVTTAAPAGAGPILPEMRQGPPWVWLGMALVLLAGLGILHRGVAAPPIGRWAVMGAIGGLLVLLQPSCGTDGTLPPTGETPTGTYELTITATWESAQTSSTATLVVQ